MLQMVEVIDQTFHIALYLNVIRMIFLYTPALGIVLLSWECHLTFDF